MDDRERAFVEAARARIDELTGGRVPPPLPVEGAGDLAPLAEGLNRIIAFMGETADFIVPLSRGELSAEVPRTRNFLASPFKELHSRLLHLTWQAKQVARGDFSQRVDFMGDFSAAFNAMVEALDRKDRELTEKIRQLEEVNRLKNEFVGMAAHDLRSPIAIIEIYAAYLLENGETRLSTKERDFLGIISRQSHFMLRLLDDLLDVTRIESGRLVLELADRDWAAFLAETVRRHADLARGKEIVVWARLPDTPLPARFDAHKMEQVLNNLIGNAVKFSPRGSKVEVATGLDRDRVRTAVIDQGPGIPAEEVPNLFRPFHRGSVKPSGGEKSTGLGLAISARIVQGHGGEIRVDTAPGRGATFHFDFPAAGPPPPAP